MGRTQDRGAALVTGASRGIGRAVVQELAARGHRTVATMRDPSAGQDLADDGIEVVALDVTSPAAAPLPDDLRVLVNNAGIERDYLPVEHTPLDQWREVFETNLFGLVELTRQAIAILRANGGGVICNVTSAVVAVPMPFYAVYRASKAAVAAATECLAEEVRGFGIRVLEVPPGPVDTRMLRGSARLPEAAGYAGYEDLARSSQAARLAIDGFTVPAADAARAIVDAIEDPSVSGRVACDPLGAQLTGA